MVVADVVAVVVILVDFAIIDVVDFLGSTASTKTKTMKRAKVTTSTSVTVTAPLYFAQK